MHNIELLDQTKKFKFEQISEFVDLFFGGRDSEFNIRLMLEGAPNDSTRGTCTRIRDRFSIDIWAANVLNHYSSGLRMGGNATLGRSFTHSCYLVLAHELRHAYQTLFHRSERAFNSGAYMSRASEVDARRYVDENYEAICDFACVEPADLLLDNQLDSTVDMISSHGIPTEDQVWDYVMEIGGDPDVNFRRIVRRLADRGISVD